MSSQVNEMISQWRSLWERLQTSYWLLPSGIVLLVLALAAASLAADRSYGWAEGLVQLVYGGSAPGARELLATLAGATITVAGVLFSVMIVVLSLASQQFGPRLLRNFMADRGSQCVLGAFIGGFLYDLLILSQVYEYKPWNTSVPRISVTLALLLAVLDFVMLIYFVHHMASMIRVETILEQVASNLDHEIERLYPERLGEEPDKVIGTAMPRDFIDDCRDIFVSRSGYIDIIEGEKLMSLAREHDLLIRLLYRPGEFIFPGLVIAQAYPRERVDDQLALRLADVLILSRLRTPTQDVEFPIHQLVEVACRALSPAMNDPFTAITCLDHLAAAMAKLLSRQFPLPLRYDESQQLRLVVKLTTVSGALDSAFNMIRQSAHDNVGVSLRLLDVLHLLARQVRRREDYASVLEHARKVQHEVLSTDLVEADRDDIRERYHRIVRLVRQMHDPSDRQPA